MLINMVNEFLKKYLVKTSSQKLFCEIYFVVNLQVFLEPHFGRWGGQLKKSKKSVIL